MQRNCRVCHRRYTDEYRGWYDDEIPHVCSGSCFADLVQFDFDFMHHIPGAMPFKMASIDFRSEYEAKFHKIALNLGLIPKYEPYYFTLPDKSRYVPDFLLNNRVFVEVKGIWYPEGRKKLRAFALGTGLPIFVVDLKMLSTLKKRY